MGCNMIEERGQILSCQKWANLCENVSEASLRNVRRNVSWSGNFTMNTFLFFWKRAISLSTFMIKCKHFQWSLLCTTLRDTSSVSLLDSPCVCTVLEKGALQLPGTFPQTWAAGCSLSPSVPCSHSPCQADGASARCQHSPGFSAPMATSTALLWALRIRKDLLKNF